MKLTNISQANTVETEQILSTPEWSDDDQTKSLAQLRGSIPLYFSQSPYAFKPVPVMHHSQETNQRAFDKHFEDLKKRYGRVQVALLVDKSGGELKLGKEYEKATERCNDASSSHAIDFEWFDFHAECRGMKFENVEKLVSTMKDTLSSFGETVIQESQIVRHQNGVIRTNCMDCLGKIERPQLLRDYRIDVDRSHKCCSERFCAENAPDRSRRSRVPNRLFP